MQVVIEGATEDGKTLAQFAELIEKRRQLLNETTEQSVAACSIQLLKSLRAATRVADAKKPYSGKPIELQGLYLSFRSLGKGGKKRIPCVRQRGSNAMIDHSKAPLVIVSNSVKAKNAKIFIWKRRSGKMYYLAGTNPGQVQAWVKKTEKKRIRKYRGLAKHALGRLMHKVASTASVQENVQSAAETVAEKNTNVQKQSSGFNSGVYSLTLMDELRYAVNALQGGHYGDITMAMQKSMKSITHVLEKRIGAPLEQTEPTENFDMRG